MSDGILFAFAGLFILLAIGGICEKNLGLVLYGIGGAIIQFGVLMMKGVA